MVKLFIVWYISMWLESVKTIDHFRLYVSTQCISCLPYSFLTAVIGDQGLIQEAVSHFPTVCEPCHVSLKFNTETLLVSTLTGAVDTLPSWWHVNWQMKELYESKTHNKNILGKLMLPLPRRSVLWRQGAGWCRKSFMARDEVCFYRRRQAC